MLFDELMNINLVVHKQIMNYRNKIIGLMVSQLDDSMQIFIPCRPSTHINEIELDFIDNVKWIDYSNTLGMLNMISNKSNGKILCTPITKLEEKPMNQASKLSLVVPVFPAKGTLREFSFLAVPLFTAPLSIEVIWYAVSSLITLRFVFSIFG